MNFKTFIIILLAFVTIIRAQQLVEGILAIVGGDIILKSEVEQQVINYAMQNNINLNRNPSVANQLKEDVLSSLIEQKLLLAKAEEDTIQVDDQMLDERLKQRMQYFINQAGSEDELEKMFGKSIVDIKKDTREIIKEQLLVEKVRAQKFRDITVSRREVEAFYNTYKD
ncbi:MAG: hypothetical protein GF347_03130, partial [Candidatus Moranbacteria bacterium]|nr:hypothetical protein [Candidatus Moranbacteria bacterium]